MHSLKATNGSGGTLEMEVQYVKQRLKLLFQHMEDVDLEDMAVENTGKYVTSLPGELMPIVVNAVLADFGRSSRFSRTHKCRLLSTISSRYGRSITSQLPIIVHALIGQIAVAASGGTEEADRPNDSDSTLFESVIACFGSLSQYSLAVDEGLGKAPFDSVFIDPLMQALGAARSGDMLLDKTRRNIDGVWTGQKLACACMQALLSQVNEEVVDPQDVQLFIDLMTAAVSDGQCLRTIDGLMPIQRAIELLGGHYLSSGNVERIIRIIQDVLVSDGRGNHRSNDDKTKRVACETLYVLAVVVRGEDTGNDGSDNDNALRLLKPVKDKISNCLIAAAECNHVIRQIAITALTILETVLGKGITTSTSNVITATTKQPPASARNASSVNKPVSKQVVSSGPPSARNPSSSRNHVTSASVSTSTTPRKQQRSARRNDLSSSVGSDSNELKTDAIQKAAERRRWRPQRHKMADDANFGIEIYLPESHLESDDEDMTSESNVDILRNDNDSLNRSMDRHAATLPSSKPVIADNHLVENHPTPPSQQQRDEEKNDEIKQKDQEKEREENAKEERRRQAIESAEIEKLRVARENDQLLKEKQSVVPSAISSVDDAADTKAPSVADAQCHTKYADANPSLSRRGVEPPTVNDRLDILDLARPTSSRLKTGTVSDTAAEAIEDATEGLSGETKAALAQLLRLHVREIETYYKRKEAELIRDLQANFELQVKRLRDGLVLEVRKVQESTDRAIRLEIQGFKQTRLPTITNLLAPESFLHRESTRQDASQMHEMLTGRGLWHDDDSTISTVMGASLDDSTSTVGLDATSHKR